jgi:tetratricopeptide (TPR) repeat protein
MDKVIATLTQAGALDRLGLERAAARDVGAAAQAWTECAAALADVARATAVAVPEMLERAAGASVQAGQREAGLALAAQAVARLRQARDLGALDDLGLAGRLGGVAMLYCVTQSWNDAVPLLVEAEALFDGTEARATTDARRQRTSVSSALATAHHFLGQHQAALAVLEPAVARAAALADTSGAVEDRIELAHLANTLGRVLLEAGRDEAALPVLQRAVADLRAVPAADRQMEVSNLLAALLNRLGHAHAALDQRTESRTCLGESVSIMRGLVVEQGLAGLADDLRTAEQDLARLSD